MKRFKKPMPVYIGKRVSEYGDGNYEMSTNKKGWHPVLGWPLYKSNGFVDSFCRRQFERVTGVRLEPGELVKVTITVEAQ